MSDTSTLQSRGDQAVDTEFEMLRHILLGEDFRRLLKMREQINDDEAFSARVSEVISQALQKRSESDTSIADVLAPTMDQAMAGSIANDPERLANSIYPIMGPAIRKSISEAINEMLDNFNSMLTFGLSWKALHWRYIAWRTGRSYSEVALLHSLEFRVEQVFLIHRETGLLLSHVVSREVDSRDPDMISGMLSAIQSFIEDSFSVDSGEALNTMRLGELTVMVQQGPYATLAAVVRGSVPSSLRADMTRVLERVHQQKHQSLHEFSGDLEPFEGTEVLLEELLKSQQKAAKRKFPWVAILVILAIVAAIGYWWFLNWQRDQVVSEISSRLANEPGIVVLSSGQDGEVDRYTLLLDPDARGPESIIEQISPEYSEFVIESYSHISADQELAGKRAVRSLQPPDSVNVELNEGVLIVSGRADNTWFERLETNWSSLSGVDSLNSEGLEIRYPVREARQALIQTIESTSLAFDVASTEIGAYTDLIPDLAKQIIELDELQASEGLRRVKLDIVGYTDETGTRTINQKIGTERAEAVRRALVAEGVDEELLNATDSLDYYNIEASDFRQVRMFVNLD